MRPKAGWTRIFGVPLFHLGSVKFQTNERRERQNFRLNRSFLAGLLRSSDTVVSHSSRSRFFYLVGLVSLIVVSLGCYGHSYAASNSDRRLEPVYGAGPSTQIVALFFEHFSKQPQAAGIAFLVPERSTKHAGGIRASGRYLFGRTGRPLTEQDKAQDKFEIVLGRVPIGFATSSDVELPPIRFPDIERIFSGQLTNWNEIGGPDAPIVLVGRESTEAVLLTLSRHFPSLVDARYQQILKRDHAVVNYLGSPAGKYAIGYGALSNFFDLNVVDIQGQPLGMAVGLVVDNKNRNDPIVKAVAQYADGEEWRQQVEAAGFHTTVNRSR